MIGQKSDYFIICYQRLTSYIFIFEPCCILINDLLSWKIIFEVLRLANWRRNCKMALNDKILYKKKSKSWLKNKNLSFEKSRQKSGQSRKSCRTTHTSSKTRAFPGKSGRMVTLTRTYIVCMPNFNQLKQHLSNLRRFIFYVPPARKLGSSLQLTVSQCSILRYGGM